MWIQIGVDVFVTAAGDVHLCGPACRVGAVEAGGVTICPVSGMTHGAAAELSEHEDDEPVEDAAAPQIKSARYVDPLDIDGSLAVRNAAQSIFLRLFARKICQPDAIVRRSLASRFPGQDVEPLLQKVKDALLSTAELDGITSVAFAFHTVISEAEKPRRVPFETVLCAVLHYSATPQGLVLDGRALVHPNAKVRALLPIERSFDTQAGVAVSSVKIGIGLIRRYIDRLVWVEPKPMPLHVGASLNTRSRRTYMTHQPPDIKHGVHVHDP